MFTFCMHGFPDADVVRQRIPMLPVTFRESLAGFHPESGRLTVSGFPGYRRVVFADDSNAFKPARCRCRLNGTCRRKARGYQRQPRHPSETFSESGWSFPSARGKSFACSKSTRTDARIMVLPMVCATPKRVGLPHVERTAQTGCSNGGLRFQTVSRPTI